MNRQDEVEAQGSESGESEESPRPARPKSEVICQTCGHLLGTHHRTHQRGCDFWRCVCSEFKAQEGL